MANRPDKTAPKRRLNWKKIVMVAAVLVVIGSIVQTVMRSGGGGAANSSRGQSASSAAPRPIKTPQATVTLNGHGVPATGGPMIILNPGLTSPGSKVGVEGSGFDRGATVRVYLVKSARSKKGAQVAYARTSRDGSLYAQFTMPVNVPGNASTVLAEEVKGGKSATAQLATHGRIGKLAIIGKGAGQPGGAVNISASGFAPGEKVYVYWGRITGPPAATMTADGSGSIGRAQVHIGVAPVGPTTLVLIGQKSRTTATAPFLMLGLYPSVKLAPYALRAGNDVTFSGHGFAPGEQVLVYLNSSTGMPALATPANGEGGFSVRFKVPFGLRGKQRLVAIGDQTRASVTSGFTVMPYMPEANASTYGAMPGTTVSFYAKGFAPNEVVRVYAGNPEQLVSAFRVDAKGTVSAAGTYVVPSSAGNAVIFTLVGQKSGGTAHVKLPVSNAGQAKVPPQKPYRLPPSLGGKPYPVKKRPHSGKSAPAPSTSR